MKTFTCDCGFEWLEGTSGSHNCEPFYRATIKKLNQELNSQSAIIRSIDQNKPDVEVNGNKFFVERGVLGGFAVTHFDMKNLKEEWMADKLIGLGWTPPKNKITCSTCKGSGELGRRPGLSICGVCGGTGHIENGGQS